MGTISAIALCEITLIKMSNAISFACWVQTVWLYQGGWGGGTICCSPQDIYINDADGYIEAGQIILTPVRFTAILGNPSCS